MTAQCREKTVLTEEQQDDDERRLRERVLLGKSLQFGPDALEDSHHVLWSAHSGLNTSTKTTLYTIAISTVQMGL